MARYSYEIGLTSTTANVENLGVNPPKGRLEEYAVRVDRLDGHVSGHGFPRAFWSFDILTQAMVDILRGYCTGDSAAIYIKTRRLDGSFVKYSAIMIWPAQEQMSKRNFNGRYLGLEFEFRHLEAV